MHQGENCAVHESCSGQESDCRTARGTVPMVECAYCSRDVATDVDEAPHAVDDDAAWAEFAAEHAPDCEWIRTRAHRL